MKACQMTSTKVQQKKVKLICQQRVMSHKPMLTCPTFLTLLFGGLSPECTRRRSRSYRGRSHVAKPDSVDRSEKKDSFAQLKVTLLP
jgi:hypothetical protein